MKKRKKIIGAYRIYSISSKKSYIGSSVNIIKRWSRHREQLKNNEHHSILLQRAYNKYGVDDFAYTIIEECALDLLLIKEKEYIDQFDSANSEKGYDILAVPVSTTGRKFSLESRLKMSLSHIGKKLSEEQKLKIGFSQKGEKHHSTKLTNDLVLEIKQRLIHNESVEAIAKAYDVSKNIINSIRSGQTWNEIGPSIEYDKNPYSSKHWNSKLSEADVAEIRILFQQSIKDKEIGERFKVNYYTISDIRRGKTWKK